MTYQLFRERQWVDLGGGEEGIKNPESDQK